MTLNENIERLEEYRDELGGDCEVRLMTQQNWPFENAITVLASGAEINESFKAKTAELKADTARATEEFDTQGDVDPSRGKSVLAVFDWSQKRPKSGEVQTPPFVVRFWIRSV